MRYDFGYGHSYGNIIVLVVVSVIVTVVVTVRFVDELDAMVAVGVKGNASLIGYSPWGGRGSSSLFFLTEATRTSRFREMRPSGPSTCSCREGSGQG